MGRNADSMAAYQQFIEDFKDSKRVKIAVRAIEIIKGNY
jgi:hypothetical protein